MSKTFEVPEAQRGAIVAANTKTFVVTGVTPGEFVIASGTNIFTVQGELDGLKVADVVAYKDGKLSISKQPAGAAKKLNPSRDGLADFGL